MNGAAEKRAAPASSWRLSVFLFCLAFTGCQSSGPASKSERKKDDLSVYRITNDQPGHEFVKTEEFLVPVGSIIPIKALEFEPGSSTLTANQRIVVQQIFNSIEEITENTPGDANTARVAEFKKMKFEIRGYPDVSGARDLGLGEQRAKAVLNFLIYLGTASERLTATAANAQHGHPGKRGKIEFIRTQ